VTVVFFSSQKTEVEEEAKWAKWKKNRKMSILSHSILMYLFLSPTPEYANICPTALDISQRNINFLVLVVDLFSF